MQRLTDVPLTFRTANRVGDATDFFRGQVLDAPRPERDGREDRLESLRRRRQGLPTEAEAVLDRLPAVLEQDIDNRVISARVRTGARSGARFEPHERGIDAGLRMTRVSRHPLRALAGRPVGYADAR